MACRVLIHILLLACSSRLVLTLILPADVALNRPYESPNLHQFNTSDLLTAILLNSSIPFKIPGTQISVHFSHFGELISQKELDLCVVEGVSSLFETVLRKGKDGSLPLNSVEYKYGNVVINLHDFSPPMFSMTYATVVTTLRGIALFSSIEWYRAMQIEVYDGNVGHVGTGDFGPIIPRRGIA